MMKKIVNRTDGSLSYLEPMDRMKILPVEGQSTSNSLKNFCHILESSIGYDGRIKILMTTGGYTEFTSTSCTLANYLNIDCPMCFYICQIMKKLPDFGLNYGVVTSSFLYKMFGFSQSGQVSVTLIINSLQKLKDQLMNFISISPNIKLRGILSIENLLLPLVKRVINGKPNIRFSVNFIHNLPLNIVKAFLFSVHEENETPGHVFIYVDEGSTDSFAFKGICYNCSDMDENELLLKIQKKKNTGVNILLFSIELNADVNSVKHILSTEIMNFIERKDIGVIACQKPVDNKIKTQLRSKNVIVLERMGEEMTQALEYLSMAQPIYNIGNLKSENLINMVGHLSCLDFRKFGSQSYLLLENNEQNISTLLVHTRIIGEHLDEVKATFKKCIKYLHGLGKSPLLVSGGGCFETLLYFGILHHLAAERNSKGIRITDGKCLDIVYITFMKCLLRGAGLKNSVKSDTKHHHAWSTDFQSTCNCGMVHKNEVNLCELPQKPIPRKDVDDYSKAITVEFQKDYVLDCYETKLGAILQALDTCINILNIGLIVTK